MSKRKYENELFEPKKRFTGNTEGKKHTLDSDEEDYVDETNVLDENDIEGEEEGFACQDGEQRMTAFNMQEELEEGHFDRDGHFIWKNEKEVRDNWLDNIDWQKIKRSSDTAGKYDIEGGLGAESDSDYEVEGFDEMDVYRKIIGYMKPKETINKAIKRLAGEETKLSSIERLKRKKAGTLKTSEEVTKLTELANQVLTRLGNMDIYQETYEQIKLKINKNDNITKQATKEPELDMYADDFDVKEKRKLNDEPSTSSESSKEPLNTSNNPESTELKWEFKWSAEDEKIEGPFNTAQMIKWQKTNHFKPGVMVRKCGESKNFYSLSRIDFELYE